MLTMLTLIVTIICINVLYVASFTLRMIFVIKGQRVMASFLSMFEVFIYLMGLTIVLDNLDKPINVVAYCIGWGMGVYMGSKIEEYMALGYVSVQIIVDSLEHELPKYLRNHGFGVTSWHGDGKDGKRLILQVLTKRSNEKKLLKLIEELSPQSFVISYEPKHLKGGFWIKRLKE
ncbi:DUF2179 domain-containing protein [Bacillaceae bacterium]